MRFQGALFAPRPHTDERVYLQAFREVAAGLSPYGRHGDQLDYYYPPAFAHLGALAHERFGERALLALFRAANLAGLVATLWIAGRWAGLGPRALVAAGTLFVVVAPPALRHGFWAGNLSLAVVGATLVALELWRQRPLGAGALLGASTLVKPIAPLGLLALAADRPGGVVSRRHLAGAALGLAGAAAALLLSPDLGDFLGVPIAIDEWPRRRTASLFRWLHLAGLPIPPAALLAAAAAGAALLVRRAAAAPRRVAAIVVVGMTLATPVVWSHTLLVTLPLQARALALAWARWRSPRSGRDGLERFELPLVALAVLTLALVDGIGGGVELVPRALQLAAITVPVAAPLALAAFLARHDAEQEPVPAIPPTPARVG